MSYPELPAVSMDAGSYPVVIIDTREQDRLPIAQPFSAVLGTLPTGDYSYLGGEQDFAIERKSIADLVGCLGVDRKRFKGQLDRLRAYNFRRLLVVGNKADLRAGHYRSRLEPLAAINSLDSIDSNFVPVVWADTPDEAARMVERWAFWHFREKIKGMRRTGYR